MNFPKNCSRDFQKVQYDGIRNLLRNFPLSTVNRWVSLKGLWVHPLMQWNLLYLQKTFKYFLHAMNWVLCEIMENTRVGKNDKAVVFK